MNSQTLHMVSIQEEEEDEYNENYLKRKAEKDFFHKELKPDEKDSLIIELFNYKLKINQSFNKDDLSLFYPEFSNKNKLDVNVSIPPKLSISDIKLLIKHLK